ncbi:hypothetical protein RI129_001574 [Pyrocoelia pectoralis]|uniref:Protein Wnt n=1 Tax=Pyrocoelia pectoralis TaxID=417401 RepID=A0AAN7VJS9_9COLE
MKMNSAHLLFVTFLLLMYCSVSFTWSSSISSILPVKGPILQPELFESLANGAQKAMRACQTVFKWDKWNCPESSFSRRIKEKATKEQAVVHAMLSAGLVHSVTKNCSKGILKGCGCNPQLRGLSQTNPKYITSSRLIRPKEHSNKKIKVEWSWGGCSDDVEYGQSLAKKVLDGLEIGNYSKSYANLHNNLVGRTIIRNTMIKKCKCHGVSGSCSLQTCWMHIAPFHKIAKVIRQRYKKAVKINVENRASDSMSSSSITKISDISKHQLAFIETSPDYCLADSSMGWPGTKGRPCSRSRTETSTRLEKRSCKNLCRHCGHKVRRYKREIKMNCNCSFKWCCEVKCDICTETVVEFFCD